MTTYDNELKLVNNTYKSDELFNQIPDKTRTTILCNVKSINRNEFYNASTAGYKPELTFVIHAYEYEGQQEVEFNGVTYKVMRTYQVGFEELELICERVLGNNEKKLKKVDNNVNAN